MVKGKDIVSLLALVLWSVGAQAQATGENAEFTPVRTLQDQTVEPSPEVWAMMKYRDAAMNFSDGTASMSVPMVSWKVGDYPMALSLDYRIRAFKADEMSGWIGLGWSLGGTGAVTRTIMGLPDENGYECRSEGEIRDDNDGVDYLRRLNLMKTDATLDRYSYSCPGGSGQFVILDGEIIQLPQTDNEISFIGAEKDGVRDFRVTTPDGVQYEFTEREHSDFKYQADDLSSLPFGYSYYAVSTWHLSKIHIPSSGDNITFTYENMPEWIRINGGKTAVRTHKREYLKACVSQYPNETWVTGAVPGEFTGTNNTRFSDSKIIKSINSRTASVEFDNITHYYSQAGSEGKQGPTLFINKIIYNNASGIPVTTIELYGTGNYRRKLQKVKISSGSGVLDERIFHYHGENGTATADFFGFPNGGAIRNEYDPVIDPITGRFSDKRKFSAAYAISEALHYWSDRAGIITTIEYEDNKIDRKGSLLNQQSETVQTNSVSLIPELTIGLRIKSITATDTHTGIVKKREYRYDRAMSDIDFDAYGIGTFIAMSGWYERLKVPDIKWQNYTYFSFLSSSRDPGYRLENAKIYYGKITEEISGTNLTNPVRNEYEYDTSRSRFEVMGGRSHKYPLDPVKEGNLPASYSDSTGWRALCSFMLPFGSYDDDVNIGAAVSVGGYTRESIGAEPTLLSRTSYEWTDSGYMPIEKARYHYRFSPEIIIPTGTYHAPLVRKLRISEAFCQYETHTVMYFDFFRTDLKAWRTECDSVTTTRYFPGGHSRTRTVAYYYTGDSIYAVSDGYYGQKNRATAIGTIGGFDPGSLTPIGHRLLNPFKADSLTRISGKRLPFGVTITEGGHTLQQFTALATQVTEGKYRTWADRGQHSLPVAQIWIVDSRDTLLLRNEHRQYLTSGWLSGQRLGVPGQSEIASMVYKGIGSHGRPTGVKVTGQPQKHYSWDRYDQLTSVTIGDMATGLRSEFTYDQLVGCTAATAPSGRTTLYGYDGVRLSSLVLGDSTLLESYSYGTNWIRTVRHNGVGQAATTVCYDGFGNEHATIAEGFGSESDVITVVNHDALGRPILRWVPVAQDALNCTAFDVDLMQDLAVEKFGATEGAHAAATITYPESAESWAASTTAAGKEFSGHPATATRLCSNPAVAELKVLRFQYDGARLTLPRQVVPVGQRPGIYQAGELDCMKTTDPDGRTSLVFTDCLGRTVLTRAIADDGAFADTYVISNSWGDPLVVLPPETSARLTKSAGTAELDDALENRAYVYSYDGQQRLRSKKFPGVQQVEFVYDSEGRVAFSRDGNQRAAGICSFRLYDAYGREALTGSCADRHPEIWNGSYIAPAMTVSGLTRSGAAGTVCQSGYSVESAMSALIPAARLLTASYYDDYSAFTASLPSGALAQPRGLPTATLMATLGGDTQQRLLTVFYYDEEERLIKTETGNLLNGSYVTEQVYNSHGLLTGQTERVSANRSQALARSHSHSYNYDRFGRPLNTILNYGGRYTRTLGCQYDNLGRLGKTWGYNNDLSCSISYNINGWATHRSTPFLTEDIWYGNGAVPQYSGKISGKDIYSSGKKQSYSYRYDRLGRLIGADYSERDDAAADFSASYSYDLEANPTVITRMGLTDVDTYGLLNHIRVDYHNGQVLGVADDADAPVLEGTLTGPVPVIKVTHWYDANGNLIKDATRGIDSIRYNVLNLPETVYFSNGYRLGYIYLADGTKLRETRRRPTFSVGAGSAGVITETTDYIGAYEYENGVPHRLNLPGGYLTLADSVYHHYIPDYQGNILAVVNTRTRQVEQRTNYYPYGMPHGNSTGAGLNKRKYSGKELITFAGYDAMDYHARWRPTSLPLFSTPDPLSEKRHDISIYAYCSGDPINKVDLDGCDEIELDENLNVIKHVVTDEHDAFYFVDKNGQRIEGASIEFAYGTIQWNESVFNKDGDGTHLYDKYVVNGDDNSTRLFEFLASKLVEVSHIQTRDSKNIATNYVTTSHSAVTEYGHNGVFNEMKDSDIKFRTMTHSHPNGLGIPSGIFIDEDFGDVYVAQEITNSLGYQPQFNIYDPITKTYISYGPQTSSYKLGLPTTWRAYQILYLNKTYLLPKL